MEESLLYQLYVVEELPLKVIAERVGISKDLVVYYVRKFKFPRRNKPAVKLMVGQKIGDWELIQHFTKSGKGYWHCKCGVCGAVRQVEVSSLNRGGSKSCRLCAMEKTRDNRVVPAHYWLKLQHHADKRNHSIYISHEWAEKLLVQQNHRCALTGWSIGFGRGRTKDGKHSDGETTASLDRINSSGEYSEGNVQWVHKDINRMKQSFDQDRLLVLCEAVLLHMKGSVSSDGSPEVPDVGQDAA